MSTSFSHRANWTFGLPKSLHALGVNLVLLPFGIATSAIIARSVGPTGKGTLDLIVATSALLAMFLSLSLPQGITYVVAQGKLAASVAASQVFLISVLQAVLALAAVGLLRWTGYLQIFLPDPHMWIIGSVVLYVWVELLNKFWSAILAGQQRIATVNNAELVGRLVQFFSIFLLAGGLYVAGRHLSVGLLFLVTLSASILINLFLVTSFDFWPQRSRNLSGLKAATAFALPCYAANTAQFLNYKLDVFVVGFFAGTAAVGRYTLAVSLAQLLWLMSNSVASALLPKVAASGDARGSIQHTMRVTRLSLWATATCGIALALMATQAIPLLYGDAFRASILALLWLLPGIVVFSIANVLAAYMAGIGKPGLNLWVSAVSLVVTVTLDFVLIPKLGIVGASIASTVSYSVSALMLTVFFVRETGASVRQLLLPAAEDRGVAIELAQPLLRRFRPERAV
jgi:O-antigen/teichoic acid export membrane protein